MKRLKVAAMIFGIIGAVVGLLTYFGLQPRSGNSAAQNSPTASVTSATTSAAVAPTASTMPSGTPATAIAATAASTAKSEAGVSTNLVDLCGDSSNTYNNMCWAGRGTVVAGGHTVTPAFGVYADGSEFIPLFTGSGCAHIHISFGVDDSSRWDPSSSLVALELTTATVSPVTRIGKDNRVQVLDAPLDGQPFTLLGRSQGTSGFFLVWGYAIC